ncbi:SGNH/GDSL hydrolase family protein [Terrimonas sp. NA20]|uniref:SGNH/GDSL hydrolase family protein n=1 Tax=Terrimonas ginsenosidimutans TaxID=2908004 RepID=A0ABS9KRG0_9BACT|nr:SGNH/GDSL hydrolase family protein [Terrimonas ginsenosidimutans]MCG2614914.1 SGNH/GDSL hydrolase family protein [Terrimonas ginsenosidimutans]
MQKKSFLIRALYIALSFLILSFGLSAKKPLIKVAFLGDSYCNGCCVAWDNTANDRAESYRYQITQWLKQYYDSVQVLKLCSGGETVRNAMPSWHPGAKPGFNIDAALNWGADLILLQYSGNDFYNGYRVDTVKKCFKYINDTLTGLGKNFVLFSLMSRKVTLGPGYTPDMFQDSVRSVNRFLDSLNPYRYLNVFDTTYDPITNRPVWSFLGGDSLHWNTAGYAAITGAIKLKSKILDSLIGFNKQQFLNTSVKKIDGVDSVEIKTAKTKVKRMKVLTSEDGVAFSLVFDSIFLETDRIAVKYRKYVMVQVIDDARRTLKTYTKIFN